MSKAVAILSGGMDSTALAHLYAEYYDAVHLVSFDYGQRHRKELESAKRTAERLGVRWTLIGMPLGGLLRSALTDSSVPIPHGHYEAETMKATVVPNRNAIMLALATGIAVSDEAMLVGIGVHAGDHAIYPDCRPEFIESMTATMRVANAGFCAPYFRIDAPFINMSKADIVTLSETLDLDVPWEETWSCYEGGAVHCGLCGTCVERREAFALADVQDWTAYA